MQPLVAWLRAQVQTVPPQLAVCEFDCSRSQCSYRDWDACDRVRSYSRLTRLTRHPEPLPVNYADA
jgi:hypothetical protein